MAMCAVGILLVEARGAGDFLEDEEVTSLQRLRLPFQRRRGGAARQTAAGVAPRIEREAVVGPPQRGIRRGLEDKRPGLQRALLVAAARLYHHRHATRSRQQARAFRHGRSPGPRHVEMHEGARVAALVHEVVDEPRVPAHRDALPRGGEVRLGSRSRPGGSESSSATYASSSTSAIADVGGRPLRPAGREQAQPVEHQPRGSD